MNENFIRLRKAELRNAALFSIVVGLSAGILTAALIMIFTKLFFEWNPLFALIGAGVGVLAFAVSFLLLRPTDARLAKKLDFGFSLDERVATTVEFAGQDGAILELQREDAENRLAEISTPSVITKKLIAAFLALALSLGALLGAFFVPEPEPPTEEAIDVFDKELILVSIAELIDMVKDVYMDENLRGEILEELTGLLDFVEKSDLLSEMKAEAILTVKAINSSLRRVNSAYVIGEVALQGYGERISKLGEALCELSGTSVKKELMLIFDFIKTASEEDVTHVADELNALVAASNVKIDDPVVVIFKSLINATYAAASAPSALSDEYEEAAAQLSHVLMVQNVNDTIVKRVTDKLCDLFGIIQSDLLTPEGEVEVDIQKPGTVTPGEDGGGEDEDDEDDTISSGGLGTGEMEYASNDLIFDPNTGTYAPYGEVLQRYYDSFLEQKLDGKISDEYLDRLSEYFNALYGSYGSLDKD